MADAGIEVPFSSAQVAALAALAGRIAVTTTTRSTGQRVGSLRPMVVTRLGDEGAKNGPAPYLPCWREHNQEWAPEDRGRQRRSCAAGRTPRRARPAPCR